MPLNNVKALSPGNAFPCFKDHLQKEKKRRIEEVEKEIAERQKVNIIIMPLSLCGRLESWKIFLQHDVWIGRGLSVLFCGVSALT